MNALEIEKVGDALYSALRERKPIAPLTGTYPGITIEEAYQIQLRMIEQRLNAAAWLANTLGRLGIGLKADDQADRFVGECRPRGANLRKIYRKMSTIQSLPALQSKAGQ